MMARKYAKLDLALFILRLGAGWIFIYEGYLKLFVIERVALANYFAGLGFPFSGFVGPSIGMLELFGGILLLAGFFTRILGVLFAAHMLVATLVANLPGGPSAALEVTTLLFFITLVIGIVGAGKLSVDKLVHKK